VLGATTLTLAGLNRVPDLAGSDPRRVRTASSLSAVEARLGQGLLVPAYFPQWLRWPPSTVRFIEGPPPAVAFTLDASNGEGPVLIVAQSLASDAEVPPRLLPGGTVMESAPVRILDEPGTLARVQLPDGGAWQDLSWTEQGRAVVFRFRGHSRDVLRMARSLRKERP
jgi:hypothetical protein